MHSRTIVRFVYLVALVVSALGLTASIKAAVPNRIAATGTDSSRVALARSVAPGAARAADLGEASGARKLDGLTLRFSLTEAQQAALSQLLIDQQNPASPLYHQWLTPQQFGARFGLSSADLAKVSSWLTAQGFTVTGTANSATFLTFSGTVAQVQKAFGTSIHSLSLNGELHFANLTEPTLPAGIAAVVGNLTGLNDFHLKSRARRGQYVAPASSDGVHPQYTATTTAGATVHFIAPGDFYTIYDVTPLLSNAINGTGIKIAVMGQVDISLSDVAAFRTAAGLSANAPTVKVYGTDPGAAVSSTSTPSTDDLAEAQLDVEWSGAAAPSASIIYVNSTDVIDTSLVQAIDNNLAPIMTVSYGNCELGFATSQRNSLNVLFQQANAQGITIFGPSGDAGATDCDSGETSATYGLTVDFPASSPFVTGVGGTTFSGDLTSTSYWNTTNAGTPVSSAVSYIPESVWNETTADLASSSPGFGAGGGGASSFFSKPTWQTGTGVPNDSSRDVPDVSLNAAADHDGYFVCTKGSCTNGTFFTTTTTGRTANVFGGTSVSTPSFAGLLALVEQKIGATTGLGNINPTLYSLGNSTYVNSVYHDITSGNNNSPCTAGTLNCPNGGTIGYSAGLGYDQATGWGSVDAFNLANDWKLVTPAVVSTLAVSTTTIAMASTNVLAGASLTLTATVAAGATSTAVPTGTVTFLVDNATVGTATALSGGTATYSLSTTGLTQGEHTIGAAYSGDTVYAGSKGFQELDVAKYFTLSPSGSPTSATTTVAAGGTAPGVTFTITPASGFVGSVAFKASALSALTAGYQFSSTPVSITASTTSATTTLTLYAYVSSTKGGPVQLNLSSAQPPAFAAPAPLGGKGSRAPWYAAGSGSVLACLLLLPVRTRRRWGTMLALLLLAGTIGMVGCGSGSSSTTAPTTTTTTTTTSQTNTTKGTYGILVTATGTTTGGAVETHTALVNFVVQ